MNYGSLVFLTAFLALAASWGGFVLAPQLQLGRQTQTKVLGGETLYPQPRPGLAAQGAQVYRANGCVYCHSQSVRQGDSLVEVVLNEPGTNATELIEAVRTINAALANADTLASLPKVITTAVDVTAAGDLRKALGVGGAKASVEVRSVGLDMERGWGKRRSVAQDFAFDYPVQPGGLRVGHDLANVGARKPDAAWHLAHLYAPQAMVEGSIMPAYRFLFEKRNAGSHPSPDALQFPSSFAIEEGYEIVPTQEARALAAYLVSLNHDVPLAEAPFSLPMPVDEPATNAPAQ